MPDAGPSSISHTRKLAPMRYAGLRAFIAIVGGIALQYFAGLPFWFWLGIAATAIVAARFTRSYSLLLVLAAASALYLSSAAPPGAALPFPRISNATFEGIVQDEPIPHRGGRTYAVQVRQVQINNERYPIDLKIRLGTGRHLEYGDRIQFVGSLLPFNYPCNPGLMDINQYFHRQGYAGQIRAYNILVTGRRLGNPVSQYLIMPVRRYTIDVIGHHFEGENRALLAGLLLGETGDLPEETMRAFSIAGITHILAVSGLNVAILIGVCTLLLSVFGVRGLPGLAATVIVAGVYVGITGFTPSAFRAGLMAIALAIGLFTERRYDSRNGLLIAGIAILLADPFALLDVGFQLSFAATGAILVFFDRIRRLLGRLNEIRFVRNWLVSPLALTIAGTLGTAPLIMYYFSRVSLLSLVANVIVVPLAGLAMPLGVLVVATHGIFHPVASLAAQTLDLNLSAILRPTETIGRIPWAALTVGRPGALIVVWLYALIFLLAIIVRDAERRARRNSMTVFSTPAIVDLPEEEWAGEETQPRPNWTLRILAVTALVGLIIMVWTDAFRRPQLRVTFLDVPQSEATLVEFPNGRNLLVDAGNGKLDLITTFLESRGISRLDLLAISHPHGHVCAGVEQLLGKILIARVLVPVDSSTGSDATRYQKILDTLRESGAEITEVSRGDTIRGFDAAVDVLSPTPLLRSLCNIQAVSPNDLSLVLRIAYQGCSVLLAGDLDHAALLDSTSSRSTVLKASHQGSVSANSDALLNMVRPDYLIVEGRARLRPRLEQTLRERGITVFNTRRDGGVVLTVGSPSRPTPALTSAW